VIKTHSEVYSVITFLLSATPGDGMTTNTMITTGINSKKNL
jgi:hypothetical protein